MRYLLFLFLIVSACSSGGHSDYPKLREAIKGEIRAEFDIVAVDTTIITLASLRALDKKVISNTLQSLQTRVLLLNSSMASVDQLISYGLADKRQVDSLERLSNAVEVEIKALKNSLDSINNSPLLNGVYQYEYEALVETDNGSLLRFTIVADSSNNVLGASMKE